MESGIKCKIFDNPNEEQINQFLEDKFVYQILHAFTGGLKMEDEKESFRPWIKMYIFYKEVEHKGMPLPRKIQGK